MTVRQAMTAFVDYHRAKGIQNSSVGNCERALRWFFDPKVFDLNVSGLTSSLVRELLDHMSRRRSRTTGKPLSVTTQRAHRDRAKAFFMFCIEREWMAENPLNSVAVDGHE